jgi:hypothetical protein
VDAGAKLTRFASFKVTGVFSMKALVSLHRHKLLRVIKLELAPTDRRNAPILEGIAFSERVGRARLVMAQCRLPSQQFA